MVHYYDAIPDFLSEWAMKQQVFFIASAPLVGQHINLSPKGLPESTLRIFDPNHIAYIDATGSGIETIAHVYENGRATIMFCSFDKSPRIMRWHCKGRVVEWDQPEFEKLLKEVGKEKIIGARAVIMLEVWKGRNSQPHTKHIPALPTIAISRNILRLRRPPNRLHSRSRKDLRRPPRLPRRSPDSWPLGWEPDRKGRDGQVPRGYEFAEQRRLRRVEGGAKAGRRELDVGRLPDLVEEDDEAVGGYGAGSGVNAACYGVCEANTGGVATAKARAKGANSYVVLMLFTYGLLSRQPTKLLSSIVCRQVSAYVNWRI